VSALLNGEIKNSRVARTMRVRFMPLSHQDDVVLLFDSALPSIFICGIL
jgi:hypothetical protein